MLDIYDGRVYQERHEFFSDPYNISFSLNYDGAPKFKSSNMQIWPIQLCINELPPKLRYVSSIIKCNKRVTFFKPSIVLQEEQGSHYPCWLMVFYL